MLLNKFLVIATCDTDKSIKHIKYLQTVLPKDVLTSKINLKTLLCLPVGEYTIEVYDNKCIEEMIL